MPPGSSFYDDFPVWDPKHKTQVARFVVRSEDGNATSCALLRAARLKPLGQSEPIKVGLIGGVCTAPEARGHGTASQLVEEAVTAAQKQGIQLLMLWGSEHSLYERIGFRLEGHQIRVPLASLVQGQPSTVKVQTGFTQNLFNAICRRPDGLLLSAADQVWFAAHKNVHWYSTEKNGSVDAYVGVHRGIDLQGFVHEWGGDHEALVSLFRHLEREEPGLSLLGPSNSFERLRIPPPEDAISEPLAMMRWLDPALEAKTGGERVWIWGLDAA